MGSYDAIIQAMMNGDNQDPQFTSPYSQFAGQMLQPLPQNSYQGVKPWEAAAASIGKGLAGGLMAGYGRQQEQQAQQQAAIETQAQMQDAIKRIKGGEDPATVFGSMENGYKLSRAIMFAQLNQEIADKEAARAHGYDLEKIGAEQEGRMSLEQMRQAAENQRASQSNAVAWANYNLNKAKADADAKMGGLKLGDVIDNEGKLRTELVKSPEYLLLAEATPLYNSLGKSLTAKSGPSSMLAVSSFARLLDPGSIVTDGQFVMTEKRAQSLPQQLLGEMKNVALNGGALSDTAKQQMYEIAGLKVGELKNAFENRAGQYRSFAENSGLRPSQIVVNPYMEGLPQAAQQQPTVAQAATVGVPQAPVAAMPDVTKMSDEELQRILYGR